MSFEGKLLLFSICGHVGRNSKKRPSLSCIEKFMGVSFNLFHRINIFGRLWVVMAKSINIPGEISLVRYLSLREIGLITKSDH